ncbi:hypothetical protein NL676_013756 [Syzygium grande]|nr:hypothetical protein NL676_013756 [Syzygium grande]
MSRDLLNNHAHLEFVRAIGSAKTSLRVKATDDFARSSKAATSMVSIVLGTVGLQQATLHLSLSWLQMLVVA